MPPPPPIPPPVSAAAVAAANFAAALKKGTSDLGGARSADDVILTVKQNKPLMAVGAGIAVLLIVLLFRFWANSGSPPACDASEVKTTIKQILMEQGAGSASIDGFAEVSYDSKTETRSCKLVATAGSDATRLEYTVEWGDKAKDKFLVQFQNN